MSRSSQSQVKALSASDLKLQEDIAPFYDDPLGFVLYAFPWGQPHTRLEEETGPDTWQIEVLTLIRDRVQAGLDIKDALPIMIAVASGHGIGKTALIAWIIIWFIVTREHPEIIVTAGKQEQLSGKTWREVAKWVKMCICGHWLHHTATKLEYILSPDTWFAHAIAWSKNAPENFAGTHEKHVLVVYDEASAIHESIWESTDGAMTTPGAMWIAFGNPTRTSGRFFDAFNKLKHLWKTLRVDSRTAKMANRRLLDEWVKTYGEDSDFVRVRVRGMFPRAGDLQFITLEEYAKAKAREVFGYEEYALVFALDVARHGTDQSVLCKRQGSMVFPLKRMRITDLMQLAKIVAAEIEADQPDMVFIDATGMGWGVVDRLHELGYDQVVGVQVAEVASKPERYHDMRAELWDDMRTAIRTRLQLPDDPELEDELTQPEYGFDNDARWVLESKKDMKKRGLASPDGADAIALTFAAAVAARPQPKRSWRDKLRAGRRGSAMTS